MRILSLECASVSASAALTDDDKLLGESFLATALKHSRTLMPMTEALLSVSETPISSVDLFAVTVGPGSFTGVRIGVAATKGMADAAGKPCFPVSALEAAAYPFLETSETVCAVMDARCMQVYTALFQNGERTTPDEALTIEALGERLGQIPGQILLVGDGTELVYNTLQEKLGERLAAAPAQLRLPRASSVAFLARAHMARGEAPVEATKLSPVYLRLPQAQRELNKKTKQKEQTV